MVHFGLFFCGRPAPELLLQSKRQADCSAFFDRNAVLDDRLETPFADSIYRGLIKGLTRLRFQYRQITNLAIGSYCESDIYRTG